MTPLQILIIGALIVFGAWIGWKLVGIAWNLIWKLLARIPNWFWGLCIIFIVIWLIVYAIVTLVQFS
jgi:hypothetical protein